VAIPGHPALNRGNAAYGRPRLVAPMRGAGPFFAGAWCVG